MLGLGFGALGLGCRVMLLKSKLFFIWGSEDVAILSPFCPYIYIHTLYDTQSSFPIFRPHVLNPYDSPCSNPYLWPEKLTFLGLLIMVSIYNFLKTSVLGAESIDEGKEPLDEQRLQYPLIKEYTLKYSRTPNMI